MYKLSLNVFNLLHGVKRYSTNKCVHVLFLYLFLVNSLSFGGTEEDFLEKNIPTVQSKFSLGHKVDSPSNFTTGAVIGSTTGSFVVHLLDTAVTRRFVGATANLREFTKLTIKSYVPVLTGIVPIRSLTVGVYGLLQQQLLSMNFSIDTTKLLSAFGAGAFLSIASAPGEEMKTLKQLNIDHNFHFRNLAQGNFPVIKLYRNIIPLSGRSIPSAMFMLAGTEYIQACSPVESFKKGILGLFISTTIASFSGHTIMAPFENARILQVKNGLTLKENFRELIKTRTLYKTYVIRSLSMSIQSGFTLGAAYFVDEFLFKKRTDT